MDRPGVNDPVRPASADIAAGRARVHPWLMSVVLHLAIFLLLGLTLHLGPRQGAMAERTADVGIVLKHQDGQTEYYEGESDGGEAARSESEAVQADGLDALFSEQSPVDPSEALPAAVGLIGPSALANGGPPHAGGALDGGPGRPGPLGGKARTRVFGTEGEGYKFVYLFDRSASMGGSGRNALSAAKAELLKSLESLDTTHQFQIIFYNETPVHFNPSGRSGKLAFANEQTKRLARNFIGHVMADGTTRHEEALMAAIRLQPDVIFFLTDADEPRLSSTQLYEINRRAAGITICAIEFGLGPKSSDDNFLQKLARQNGGQYAYVDITRLVPTGRGAR